MKRQMDEFIHHCNLANYRRMLDDAPEGPRRKVLVSLLADECASAQANGWLPAPD